MDNGAEAITYTLRQCQGEEDIRKRMHLFCTSILTTVWHHHCGHRHCHHHYATTAAAAPAPATATATAIAIAIAASAPTPTLARIVA